MNSLNPGLGGACSRGQFSLAVFTAPLQESNAQASPASEADVTQSTRALFPSEFSALELPSQTIQLPVDWHSHIHCRPYIFST